MTYKGWYVIKQRNKTKFHLLTTEENILQVDKKNLRKVNVETIQNLCNFSRILLRKLDKNAIIFVYNKHS